MHLEEVKSLHSEQIDTFNFPLLRESCRDMKHSGPKWQYLHRTGGFISLLQHSQYTNNAPGNLFLHSV